MDECRGCFRDPDLFRVVQFCLMTIGKSSSSRRARAPPCARVNAPADSSAARSSRIVTCEVSKRFAEILDSDPSILAHEIADATPALLDQQSALHGICLHQTGIASINRKRSKVDVQNGPGARTTTRPVRAR